MYILGLRVFATISFGLLTAGIFALTPLLWSLIRNAPTSIYPLPFVLGWLVAVARVPDARTSWWAVAGGLLGAGVYTSYAATVMMPVYLVLTLAVALRTRGVRSRQLVVFVAAFLAAAGPFAIFLVRDPSRFRAAVMGYHLYDANRFNVLQGVREMTSWLGLTARSEVYYDYFNPAFLFLGGRVLLLPLLVLIPVGVYFIVVYESSLVARVSLAGFLAAPFAAALTADPPVPGRIRFITPFAAILAAYGLKHLFSRRRSTLDIS